MDYDMPILEKEQDELITKLVNAAHSTPRERRRSFRAYWPGSGTEKWIIEHMGLPNGRLCVHPGDLQILGQRGFLVTLNKGTSDWTFDVDPRGFSYYAEMKIKSGEPIQHVEKEIGAYLRGDDFQGRYPEAYKKWIDAESKLWGSDSADQFTTIGHLCREALQEFAKGLIEKYKPEKVDPEMAHTKNRIKSVIDAKSAHLGDRERSFLDALNCYWDSIDNLTQRQEHGAQKEGEGLLWEDGRRLVFNVAVVMFEIDRALT